MMSQATRRLALLSLEPVPCAQTFWSMVLNRQDACSTIDDRSEIGRYLSESDTQSEISIHFADTFVARLWRNELQAIRKLGRIRDSFGQLSSQSSYLSGILGIIG